MSFPFSFWPLYQTTLGQANLAFCGLFELAITPNDKIKYRVWLSEEPISEQVAQTLANQGWEKVTVLNTSFCLRKYYFIIYKSLKDLSYSEKIFDDQLENIYNQLGNIKLKTACGVLVLLLSWLGITLFFEFMHWHSPLSSTAAVFPFAMLNTIYIGRTMVNFCQRLKDSQANALTREELNGKTKAYRNMKIFGFVLSASLFTVLYYSQLGI